MNLGLKAANEKIYNALMYSISVTEFIDGKKASPTMQLIGWSNINNYHLTLPKNWLFKTPKVQAPADWTRCVL